MSKKILVVEDDKAIAEIVHFILEEAGFEVQLANSAKEFVDCFSNYHADLIIFDIRLPDGNGLDLCKSVRYDDSSKGIPIILMSAHALESEILKDACADAFIPKPFEIDDFLFAVNKQICA